MNTRSAHGGSRSKGVCIFSRLALALGPLAASLVMGQSLAPSPALPPTWPQAVTVQGTKVQTFGFPITQPGPITVDVQTQGAPVVVSLQGPNSPGPQQQGTGALHLAFAASAQDVQKGALWLVSVRLVQAVPTGIARGSIQVQSPPVSAQQLQAVTAGMLAQAPAVRAKLRATQIQPAASAQQSQIINARLAQAHTQLQQQTAQRQATLLASLQPQLTAARAKLANPAVARAPVAATATRLPIQVGKTSLPPTGPAVPQSGTFPLQSAANPAISGLSISQGQPGDPVMISGGGFGSATGEVHFVVGLGANGAPVDLVAPVAVWTDGQVFTSVPGTPNGGLIAFNGTVYIKRPDQVLSNLQSFSFAPALDRRLITIPGVPSDAALTNYNGDMFYASSAGGISRFNVWCFWTENGDDKFFPHTLLKNGWKVYDTPATVNVEGGNTFGGAPGAADIVESRVGTNSPYVDVSWWIAIGPFCTNYYGYSLTIPIEGPLGTPDGVVVQ